MKRRDPVFFVIALLVLCAAWFSPVVRQVSAQNGIITTIPDITGDGSAHVLSLAGNARWVQIIAPSTNSGVVRIGDSGASATEGWPIAPGGGMMLPPGLYGLGSVYYYAGVGDKLAAGWGN